MEIIKNFFKGYWKIIVFCILAVPVTVFGYIAVGGGVQLVAGEVYNLVYGGQTYALNNTTGQNIFIPNNAPGELASFIASPLAALLSGGPCVPTSCLNYCGPDGCNGTCSCSNGYSCQGTTCVQDCVPRCSSGATGESCQDGCGGLCPCSPGTCDGTTCVEGGGGCTSVCANNYSLPDKADCSDTCTKPCRYACNYFDGCNPENNSCTRSPECGGTGLEGETCGLLTSWGSVCGCADGFSCDVEKGTCMPFFYVNQKCLDAKEDGLEGSPCGSQYGEGLFCGCDNIKTNLICDARTKTCAVNKLTTISQVCLDAGNDGKEGSPCGVEYEPGLFCGCDTGLTCDKGTCIMGAGAGGTPVKI